MKTKPRRCCAKWVLLIISNELLTKLKQCISNFKSLAWRKAQKIDTILEDWDIPEVLSSYYSMGVCGKDKFNCPRKWDTSYIDIFCLKITVIIFPAVWISAYGSTDLKGLMMSVDKKTFARYFAYISEKSIKEMHRLSELSGKSVLTQTVIMDMQNLSARQMGYKPGRNQWYQDSHHIMFISNSSSSSRCWIWSGQAGGSQLSRKPPSCFHHQR